MICTIGGKKRLFRLKSDTRRKPRYVRNNEEQICEGKYERTSYIYTYI